MLFLKGVAVFMGICLVAAPLLGAAGSFSYLLIISVLSSSLCLVVYEKKWLHPGRRLEALIEGNFFLTGLLGLMWQILT